MGGRGLLGGLAVVVGVDLLVAAVGLDYGGDEDDGVVADVLDEGRVFDDEAVGELDEHLGAAGLGGVDAGGDPVDGLGGVDDLLGLLLGGLAGVGEGGQIGLIFVEVLHRLFGADGEDYHVAAFFGLERHLPELGARGVFGQLFVVAIDVGVVVELAGLAGHGAEELERRGDGLGGGEMIDEVGGEARVGEVFLDLGGVVGVVGLLGRGLLRGGDGGEECEEAESERAVGGRGRGCGWPKAGCWIASCNEAITIG